MKTDRYGRPEKDLLGDPAQEAQARTWYEFYLVGENGSSLSVGGGWNSIGWRSESEKFPQDQVGHLNDSLKYLREMADSLGLDIIPARLARRAVTETVVYTRFEEVDMPEGTNFTKAEDTDIDRSGFQTINEERC